MLRAVLIDSLQAPDLVATLEQLVTAKGKALQVGLLEPAADLTAVETYQTALRKLGSRVPLHDCLLASGDAARARAAEGVKELEVLHVSDAAALPMLVAARLGGESAANLEHALRAYLEARHSLDLIAIESSTPERITFRATAWRPIEGADLGDASGVAAPFPVDGVVMRRADGHVASVTISEPSDEALQEARNFVASLVHHGQLETHARGQRTRSTHQIVVDAQGRRRLIRSRVSYR